MPADSTQNNSSPHYNLLERAIKILLFIILVAGALYLARKPLIPLSIAILLAMSVVPLSRKVEKYIGKRWLGAFTASFTVLFFLMVVIGVVIIQISQVAKDWDQFKEKGSRQIETVEEWMIDHTPISPDRLGKMKDKLRKSTSEDVRKMAGSLTNVSADFLLILIYIYLLIYYRHKFRKFFCQIAPATFEENPDKLLDDTADIVQAYLSGKFLVTIMLAVGYAIGLTIIGIKYAFLVAVIGAVLNLVPYLGNVIAGGLGIALALLTGSSSSAVIGVVGVFSFFQLLENYLLTPLIMEQNIELNPFFTILSIILGGALWGIPGMIIGIPYLAVMKVVVVNLARLEPLGELLEEQSDNQSPAWLDKLKGLFQTK